MKIVHLRSYRSELRREAGINLVDVQILIPHSLRAPPQGNRVGEAYGFAGWWKKDLVREIVSRPAQKP